jgi:hypothetical protein
MQSSKNSAVSTALRTCPARIVPSGSQRVPLMEHTVQQQLSSPLLSTPALKQIKRNQDIKKDIKISTQPAFKTVVHSALCKVFFDQHQQTIMPSKA